MERKSLCSLVLWGKGCVVSWYFNLSVKKQPDNEVVEKIEKKDDGEKLKIETIKKI